MTEADLTAMVLSMTSDLETVRATCTAILHGCREERPDAFYAAEHLFAELTMFTLDAMGAGETDELRALASTVAEAMTDAGRGLDWLDDLPHDQPLAARLCTLAQLITAFTRTSNTARLLAELSGRRRATWREALYQIDQRMNPMSANDLKIEGVFNSERAALYALRKLEMLGFVRTEEVGGAFKFDLTWTGRAAVAAIDRRSSDGDQLDHERAADGLEEEAQREVVAPKLELWQLCPTPHII